MAKKEATQTGGFFEHRNFQLSLGELGSATGGLQAVLLSFLHSGVTGQETGGLQRSAVLGVQGQQARIRTDCVNIKYILEIKGRRAESRLPFIQS